MWLWTVGLSALDQQVLGEGEGGQRTSYPRIAFDLTVPHVHVSDERFTLDGGRSASALWRL